MWDWGPEAKSHAAVCWTTRPSRLWTRCGPAGACSVLHNLTYAVPGAARAISVLSKDYRPSVQYAVLKMISFTVPHSTQSASRNEDTFPNKEVASKPARFVSVAWLRRTSRIYSLQIPIKEGFFKKSWLSQGFPFISWILGTWIPVHGKLSRIWFASFTKHFDEVLGTIQIRKRANNKLNLFSLNLFRLHGFNCSTDGGHILISLSKMFNVIRKDGRFKIFLFIKLLNPFVLKTKII